jgi:arylsulfatase A-like enzyme
MLRQRKLAVLLIIAVIISSCTGRQSTTTEQQQEEKRPNIVLIMADDMGFSDIGCYGGEVETPSIDGLAKGGLKYTQFYNNARCCPTRASLMTGVYPQQAGMGWMTAADLGTPEYQGELNDKTVTIAEVLKDAGYATYMSGKWHLSRVRNIRAGIKTNWPSQRGFDRFFGIVDGASNYFNPMVFSDNETYRAPGEDFYFTHAVSDSSVMFMDQHFKKSSNDPFFMYVAYTAPHWPLHALEEDIEKYKDVYTAGWDVLRAERLKKQKELGIFDNTVELSPRDSRVPAWNELSEEEQEEFAMRMAIYAAQIDAMDQGIGRIVNKLKKEGEIDNTLIMFLSDNGACAEYISSGESKAVNGKANTWESYRIHWANLGSTPYKEYKHWTHEGGIATPFIVHWPEGIKAKNEFVREPGHINDVMATCIAVAGAEYPSVYKGNEIIAMQGQSLIPHFNGERNNRKPIYWEHEANIGVRDGKWKLVAKTEENSEFDPANLELYNMDEDPAELNNLAEVYPEKLQTLFDDWKEWADMVNVHMDTREYGRRAREYQRQINGEFDELTGGWVFSGQNNFSFLIDTTGQISGANSAKIIANADGKSPGILKWPMAVQRGESFDISLKAKGAENVKLKVFFKPAGSKGESLVEQNLILNKDAQEVKLNTAPAYENGRHQLSFEVSGLKPGEEVWIDDVQLKERH